MNVDKTVRCDGTELPAGATDDLGRPFTVPARDAIDAAGWHVGDNGHVHDAFHNPLDPATGSRIPPAHVAAQETNGDSHPQASGQPAEDLGKGHRALGSGQFLPEPHDRPFPSPRVLATDTNDATTMAAAFKRPALPGRGRRS